MGKSIACRDFGPTCDYAVCARTEEEVLQKIGDHIQNVHAMRGFSGEFYQKALATIHEEKCEQEMSREDREDREDREELLCEACSEVCLC
jgi:predicted small metal-binding protein